MNRILSSIFKPALVLLLVQAYSERSVAGTFSIPLDRTNGWQFLKYRKIRANTFRVTETGLEVGVTNSAAPAMFSLPNPLAVTEVMVSGRISGSLRVPPDKQGQKGYDDYTLRVGLVEPGSRTLNWVEKRTSPDWVKRLFALAPPGIGISKIHFLNVGTDAQQIGQFRVPPLSKLMEETVVAVPDAAGRFAFTKHFASPLGVIGIWIACDGDDTKSSFAVMLEKMELRTPDTGAVLQHK